VKSEFEIPISTSSLGLNQEQIDSKNPNFFREMRIYSPSEFDYAITPTSLMFSLVILSFT
jgi:hypothetical protein